MANTPVDKEELPLCLSNGKYLLRSKLSPLRLLHVRYVVTTETGIEPNKKVDLKRGGHMPNVLSERKRGHGTPDITYSQLS